MKKAEKILAGVAVAGIGVAAAYYFLSYRPTVPPYVPDPPGTDEPPSISGCGDFLDDLKIRAPSIEFLTYNLYWTISTIDEVLDFYDDELTSQWYWLATSGNIIVDEYDVTYAGYIRGFSAAAVLIVPDIASGYCVLFATGSIWRFRDVYRELGIEL